MSLNKRTYISKQTTITAQNLNDIQGAIIALEDSLPSPLPHALTIKIGGTTVTYDGSSAQTVTIDDGTEVSY